MFIKKTIKSGQILALSLAICLTPIIGSGKVNAKGNYYLDSKVTVYNTAEDAKNKKKGKSTYSKGTYYIYKEHHGMLNISKHKGSPGAWINPGKSQVNKPSVKNTKTYKSKGNVWQRTGPSTRYSKVKLLTKGTIIEAEDTGKWLKYIDGEKIVYSSKSLFEGYSEALPNSSMIKKYRATANVWQRMGPGTSNAKNFLLKKGSVIEGEDVGKWLKYMNGEKIVYSYKSFFVELPVNKPSKPLDEESEPSTPIEDKGNNESANLEKKYRLNDSVSGYSTSYDAKNKINPNATYAKGDYYIYKEDDGMLNISRYKNSPGIWINPVDNKVKIEGKNQLSEEQMVKYLKTVYPEAPEKVLSLAAIYLEEGEKEGIRGDIAFVQSLLETGNFKFENTAVSLDQNNFSGLGVFENGMKGHSFDSPNIGVRAQIQHLKAYANSLELNEELVDPRFQYVRRGIAPYVDWLGAQENPYGYGWAMGKGYGERIIDILSRIDK